VFLRICPLEYVLPTLFKLRPLLAPDQGVFSTDELELFVQLLQHTSSHGGSSARLEPPDEAALRQDLQTATVLAAVM
jgi:hypothetical protein